MIKDVELMESLTAPLFDKLESQSGVGALAPTGGSPVCLWMTTQGSLTKDGPSHRELMLLDVSRGWAGLWEFLESQCDYNSSKRPLILLC